MSASSVHSLASTQDDDVASIEWGVSTAASYNTEDEGKLLNWAALTPPVAYEDDVSEKSAVSPHSPHALPHHQRHAGNDDEEEEETVEVARRDATAARRSIGEEFTARVHELLHESKAAIKASQRAQEAENEHQEGEEGRQDSEEEGVTTALEIGTAVLPATPRRPAPRAPSAANRDRVGGRVPGSSGPLPHHPPTPRPAAPGRMRLNPLAGLAPPPPFFGAPPHRSMYGNFAPGPFGPLGYGGPSMRPFNSLPVGPLPPHLTAGGLGRPLHLGGGGGLPPLPPRAYMGGGPPAGMGPSGMMGPRGAARPHLPHYAHHPHPPPFVPSHHHQQPHHHLQQQHTFSPPTSVIAERRAATRRGESESSPRAFAASSALSTLSSSASPRTAPASLERPPNGRGSLAGAGREHSSSSPPTMASLGIGHAAVSSMLMSSMTSSTGAELTPYPLVYVSPAGSISCVLNHDIVVEMAVDRSVRIVLHDNFAAFCNARGTSSAILHPTARILHTEEYVYTKFIANNEKMAVFGEQGVLFTMSHLSEAYLVNSSAYPGASAVALDQLQFPTMDDDYTIKMFYTEAQTGQQFIALCKDIVSEATYDRRPDGSLYLHINGMLIRQSVAGDVIIDARPRQISCSPSKKSVHVRSGCIDMAVEEDERGYVKRAHKRVHVSRSGMVISDGNCITSMDHFGRIVCCN